MSRLLLLAFAIGLVQTTSGCAHPPAKQEAEPAAAPAPKPEPKPEPASYTETIPGTTVTIEMVFVPDANVWMGRTEVTWAQFETYFLTEETEEGVDAVARPSPPYEAYDRGWGRGRRPAVGMSRHGAEMFCEWLSKKTGKAYRLPTEEEWELAARAGAESVPAPLTEHAWFKANSEGKTQEVGRKRPNRYGLFDMLGNVAEYCSGPEPILRGGCWNDDTDRVTFTARQEILFAWNERDPQRPRSEWWFADGPYTGFRVVRPQ